MNYTAELEVPFNCIVTKVSGVVIEKLGDIDAGTVEMKNDSGTSMTSGLLSFIICAPQATLVSVTPSTNNTFAAGESIKMTVDKNTPGGLINMLIFVTRT